MQGLEFFSASCSQREHLLEYLLPKFFNIFVSLYVNSEKSNSLFGIINETCLHMQLSISFYMILPSTLLF